MRKRARSLLVTLIACASLVCSIGAAVDYSAANVSGGWSAFLTEVFRATDVIGFALLTLTLVLLGMALDLLLNLRVGKLIPENLLADVQAEMANGEYERALELCEKSNCLIGQVFAAGLSKTDYSFERMSEALKGELEIQGVVWRQWVAQFRITALTGFFIGLCGAVISGMRFVADLVGRPNLGLALASSFEMRALIYNTLFALLLGLTMSIISLLVYAIGSSKLEKILLETGRLGEELLDPFRPLPVPPEE